MPTNEPSNAPDTLPKAANDRETAAGVLGDANPDAMPGGGGLGGAAGAKASLGGGAGGTAPNAPIDTGLADDGDAAGEARRQASDAAPEPDHPTSR